MGTRAAARRGRRGAPFGIFYSFARSHRQIRREPSDPLGARAAPHWATYQLRRDLGYDGAPLCCLLALATSPEINLAVRTGAAAAAAGKLIVSKPAENIESRDSIGFPNPRRSQQSAMTEAVSREAALAASMLPYPRRFEEASKAAGAPLHGKSSRSNDGALVMFALYMQATEGDCNMEQPSLFQTVRYAKWRCWSALRGMEKPEAMRRYVKAVEEENPGVWATVASQIKSRGGDSMGTVMSLASPRVAAVGVAGEAGRGVEETDQPNAARSGESKRGKDGKRVGQAGATEAPLSPPPDAKAAAQSPPQTPASKPQRRRYGGTPRRVGAVLSALAVAEADKDRLSDFPAELQGVLQAMLATKALLSEADDGLRRGRAAEAELRKHVSAFDPTNTAVEASSALFSREKLADSKSRAAGLVTSARACMSRIDDHISTWRRAIRDELAASEEGDGSGMLGDRGSFGFQALAVLLPMRTRFAEALERWTSLDQKFSSVSVPAEASEESVCVVS